MRDRVTDARDDSDARTLSPHGIQSRPAEKPQKNLEVPDFVSAGAEEIQTGIESTSVLAPTSDGQGSLIETMEAEIPGEEEERAQLKTLAAKFNAMCHWCRRGRCLGSSAERSQQR